MKLTQLHTNLKPVTRNWSNLCKQESFESSHTIRNKRHVRNGAQVVCSVDPGSKPETMASRRKQERKIKIGKLSKGMQEVQKPTKLFEINNSYSQFSKANYEAAIATARIKSSKWVSKDLYFLHKQLKAEYRHGFRDRIFLKWKELSEKR